MNLFIFVLIAAHFLGDWICQPRWMALGKSRSIKTLLQHVGVVSAFLFLFSFPFIGWAPALLATIMNAATHAFIDWNGWKFYKKKFATYTDHGHLNNYWFYATIAIDQFLHLAIIIILFTT